MSTCEICGRNEPKPPRFVAENGDCPGEMQCLDLGYARMKNRARLAWILAIVCAYLTVVFAVALWCLR